MIRPTILSLAIALPLLVLPSFVYGQTPAQPPACLAGSPQNNFYVNLFNKQPLSADTDNFLKYYKENVLKQNPTEAGLCCLIPEPSVASNAQSPVHAIEEIEPAMEEILNIPYTCIKASLSHVGKNQAQAAATSYCSNRNSAGLGYPPGINRKIKPCINEDMAKYIYWTVNQALACYNSALADDNKIDSDAILKAFNVESGFAFYIHGVNGMGMSQLTTDGARETRGNQGDGKTPSDGKIMIDNIVQNHKECEPFRKNRQNSLLLSTVKDKYGHTDTVARICQFNNIGEGIATSALDGIGLYLFYRNKADAIMTSSRSRGGYGMIPKGKAGANPDYNKIRSLVTLALYNGNDNGAWESIASALKSIGQTMAYSKTNSPDKITVQNFYNIAMGTNVLTYLKESEERYAVIKNDCPYGSLSEYR
jgi:hypothetical protein